MAIRIHIPTPLRQLTEGKAVVEASGSTLQALIADLDTKFPGMAARLIENGQMRRFVNVYINDEDIRYLSHLETPIKDGDVVSIIPAVAGG